MRKKICPNLAPRIVSDLCYFLSDQSVGFLADDRCRRCRCCLFGIPARLIQTHLGRTRMLTITSGSRRAWRTIPPSASDGRRPRITRRCVDRHATSFCVFRTHQRGSRVVEEPHVDEVLGDLGYFRPLLDEDSGISIVRCCPFGMFLLRGFLSYQGMYWIGSGLVLCEKGARQMSFGFDRR